VGFEHGSSVPVADAMSKAYLKMIFVRDEKVFANTPANNKGNTIFYTLFGQHVSTLTWVLFR
jgi:hypothetical protein